MSNFNIKEIQKEKFYRLPKVFFTNPKYTKLSNDAKITWSILRDRLDLSIKNNWIDENGDIFGSVAKLKLYAHLYKTIKANIVLTVKSFVSVNYFSFFSINIT